MSETATGSHALRPRVLTDAKARRTGTGKPENYPWAGAACDPVRADALIPGWGGDDLRNAGGRTARGGTLPHGTAGRGGRPGRTAHEPGVEEADLLRGWEQGCSELLVLLPGQRLVKCFSVHKNTMGGAVCQARWARAQLLLDPQCNSSPVATWCPPAPCGPAPRPSRRQLQVAGRHGP